MGTADGTTDIAFGRAAPLDGTPRQPLREPPDDDPGTPLDPDMAYEEAARTSERIATKTRELRELDEARRRLKREQRAGQARPRPVALNEFLARTYDSPTYRIEQVWPTGGRVLLAAQFKAGKTTLMANTLRALVDGDDFLDRFPVAPGARVLLVDNELDERMLHQWLSDQQIRNTHDVRLLSLRGRVETFDILDRETRAEWAADIAGSDVVIFDCLRPVLDALGLDENRDSGRFLVAFDALLTEAGATEAVVVHHMGHTGERSRGDSRLQDWPDALWKLVRDKDDDDPTIDDPTGARFFSAFGRDVDVRQAELTYDTDTRRLTMGDHAMTRTQSTARRHVVRAEEAVLAVVAAHPGIKKTDLRKACATDHDIGRHGSVDSAVDRLVRDGLITRKVIGRSHLHYPAEKTLDTNVPHPPDDAPGTPGGYVPRAYRGAHTNHTPNTPHQPTTTPGHTCPHGMPNGNQPDPFVNGRLACPQCAQEPLAAPRAPMDGGR